MHEKADYFCITSVASYAVGNANMPNLKEFESVIKGAKRIFYFHRFSSISALMEIARLAIGYRINNNSGMNLLSQ